MLISNASLTIANLQSDPIAMNTYVQDYIAEYTSSNVVKALFNKDGGPNWNHITNLINVSDRTLSFWILYHLEKEPVEKQEDTLKILYFFLNRETLTRTIYLNFPGLTSVLENTKAQEIKTTTPICPYEKSIQAYANNTFTAYELETILTTIRQSKCQEDQDAFLSTYLNRVLSLGRDQEVVDAIQGCIDNNQKPIDSIGIGNIRQNLWCLYITGLSKNNENYIADSWRDTCIKNIVELNIEPSRVIEEIEDIRQSNVFKTEIQNDEIDIFIQLMKSILYAEKSMKDYLSAFGQTYIDQKLESDPHYKILSTHYQMWMKNKPLETLEKYASFFPAGTLVSTVLKDKKNDWAEYTPDMLYFIASQVIESTHDVYIRNSNDLNHLFPISMSMNVLTKLQKIQYPIPLSLKAKIATQALISAEQYLVDTFRNVASSCLSLYDLLVEVNPNLLLPPVITSRQSKDRLDIQVDPSIKDHWMKTIIQWCNTTLSMNLTIEDWEGMCKQAHDSKKALQAIVENYSMYECIVNAMIVSAAPTEEITNMEFGF